jgi:pyruvate formate lyase activating enzyme
MNKKSSLLPTRNVNPAKSGPVSWDTFAPFPPSIVANRASIANGSASLNRSVTRLKVGGLTRLSTCDWPGQLAATVFCQGCAWDCPYCHNPGLRPVHSEQLISWNSILDFLASRRGLLDAVVFSGGEPTLQPAILDAAKDVRKLGFRVALHTAGMNPECFVQLLPLLDWVGFDVKECFADYAHITGVERSGDKALESLRSLLASDVPYEVRTTVHPTLLSLNDMRKLKAELLSLGVTHYVIQRFRFQGARPELLPPTSAVFIPRTFGVGFLHFDIR